ncbi:hypothetical protein BJ508DRAFT_323416 [Ascobolus immersus RN42]|uniref:Uncharacterized protein n=1 Tax=Ascobolus immersus RN42 TaxID=1160509 RepID=A0A3N4IK44_ASCIM|nr:hypothetical protein BJ508DRAFT_323416 [Ascobolus immersus RN42]
MIVPKAPVLSLHTRLQFQSHILTISHLSTHLALLSPHTPIPKEYDPKTSPTHVYTELLRILTLQTHIFGNMMSDRIEALENALPSPRKMIHAERKERIMEWVELARVLQIYENTLKALDVDVKKDVSDKIRMEALLARARLLGVRYWACGLVELDIQRLLQQRVPVWREAIERKVDELEQYEDHGMETFVSASTVLESLNASEGTAVWPGDALDEDGELRLEKRVEIVRYLGMVEMLLDQYRDKQLPYRRLRLDNIRIPGDALKQFHFLVNMFFRSIEEDWSTISEHYKELLFTVKQAQQVHKRFEGIVDAALQIMNDMEKLTKGSNGWGINFMCGTLIEHLKMRRLQFIEVKGRYDSYCDSGPKSSFFGGNLNDDNDDENLVFGVEWDSDDSETE